MAWTAPKVQAVLIRLRPTPAPKPTGNVGRGIYGASPRTLASEERTGVQKSGRY